VRRLAACIDFGFKLSALGLQLLVSVSHFILYDRTIFSKKMTVLSFFEPENLLHGHAEDLLMQKEN
jgi:hypothetical protein